MTALAVLLGIYAFALLFVIGAFRAARRADEATLKELADEADRVVRLGDQHPWTLK